MDQQPLSPPTQSAESIEDVHALRESQNESVSSRRKIAVGILSLIVTLTAGVGSGVASGALFYRAIEPECRPDDYMCGVAEFLLTIVIGAVLGLLVSISAGRETSRRFLPGGVAEEVYVRTLILAVLCTAVLFYAIDKSKVLQGLLF